MFDNILPVAKQVFILFTIIGVGFAFTKLKLLDKQKVSGLIDIVVYIVTPSNIIISFQRDFKNELLMQLGLSFVLALLVFFLNFVIARIFIKEKNPDKNCVLQFAAALPNAGYMALPLQKAVLGDIGVFYGASYIAIFHCYVWTYGVKLLSKEKSKINFKKIIFK